jgi:glycosyltransferase involved in cell wall biosynthesis
MLRLLYISKINLLSGRTHVYNLAKTCEALNAQPGVTAALVTTDQPHNPQSFFDRLGIRKPFEVACLGITNSSSPYGGRWWYEWPMLIWSNLCLCWYLWWQTHFFDVIYFRDESLFLAAWFGRIILGKKVFFEIHSVYERAYRQLKNVWSARVAHGVVAISAGLKYHYQRLNPNVLVSLCSAADTAWFNYSQSKDSLRQELGLPQPAFIIGYTGVVGANPNNDYYELDDIVKSLPLVPADITFVIVGEINNNAAWLRTLASELGVTDRLIIVPWQERKVIPKYLQAFDITLIPKRKKDLVGDSPAKMFPALAAKRAIIGGRTECIEEVLTHNVDALIVESNTPEGWVKAINALYQDPALRSKLVAGALVTQNKYTWEKRGEAIVAFIRNTIS